ncbi:MAG: FG-GAP-like repeat-containing protein [Bacteroidota bacterium]
MKFKLTNLFLLCCFAFLSGNTILAQSFTRITEGPLVNDGAESAGCAWGDYDNDGDEDLYVTNGDVLSRKNFLFRNEGPDNDYTFTRITEGDLVRDGGVSRAASWGDYDNDGDLDLFIANQRNPEFDNLYQNNGDSTFTRLLEGIVVSEEGRADPGGWVDYNNDGHLDIFVGNLNEKNYLYHNSGDGTFAKYQETPLATDEKTGRYSWGDYDNDGDLDLVTAKRFVSKAFFINKGSGDFFKVTEGMVLNDPDDPLDAGIFVDYDNDGDWDIINAGHAIYRNEGPDNEYKFTKITTGDIVTDDSISIDSWADFDNDGDIDCYVTNFGDVDYAGHENSLYSNNGNGTFTKITEGDIVSDISTSTGTAWADYDNDGDMDVYVCNTMNNNNALYRNDNNNGNSWVKIKLNGTVSNHSAIGAIVKVKANTGSGPVWQMRCIEGQSTLMGQNSLIAHFGLGSAAIIDSLMVLWPAGHDTLLTNVAVNQLVTLTEKIPSAYLQSNFVADSTFARGELTVNFTDLSIHDAILPISWSWDFDGDGTVDSQEQNPVHTFQHSEGDVYDVSMAISNGADADTLTRTDYIRIYPWEGNLAPWGIATSSSVSDVIFYPQKTIDGDSLSYWSSTLSVSEWLKIELDSVYTLGRIIIQWNMLTSKSFTAQTSMDDIQWDTIYCVKRGLNSRDTIRFTGKEAKYVKMQGSDIMVYSIKEFEIYHSDGKEYDLVLCPPDINEVHSIKKEGLKIYPNPAMDELILEFGQEQSVSTTLKLMDSSGKVVHSEVINSGMQIVNIDLSRLSKGVYFIQISTDRNTFVEKFVKY